MIWDPIIKKYPDDTEHVKQAREIYEFIYEAMQTLPVPELNSSIKKEDIFASLDYSLLADICRKAWGNVFSCEPDIDMHEAISAFIKDETLPDVPDDKQDTIAMFVRPAATLYLTALREKNADLIENAQNHGECPFCRAYPRIAFDLETARKMSCLLCGQEWEFPRIKCSYCGNNDHESLGYFEAEGIEGVKVYYCDQCKYYIKVIDTRVREVFDAETEDVLTLIMDELAREEGYL